MDKEMTRLSKAIARALRHKPELYQLELDQEGWAPLDQLLAGLRSRGHPSVSVEHIHRLMEAQKLGKVRYELDRNEPMRIRALHGHSAAVNVPQIELKPSPPPKLLFHGTSQAAADLILQGAGLQPMGRQYVHLSTDKAMARTVGRRRAREPVVLEIEARDAFETGSAQFYYQTTGDTGIWLSDAIPSKFIRISEIDY